MLLFFCIYRPGLICRGGIIIRYIQHEAALVCIYPIKKSYFLRGDTRTAIHTYTVIVRTRAIFFRARVQRGLYECVRLAIWMAITERRKKTARIRRCFIFFRALSMM